MSWRKLVVLGLVAYAAVFCQTTTPQPSPRLRGPIALIGGGPLVDDTRFRYMFIVGGKIDAVYAMDTTLSTTDGFVGQFVRGPNKFFPLEIPVDPQPIDAVGTKDGKYLLVVTAGSDWPDRRANVNVIDMQTLAPALDPQTNEPARLPEGTLGRGPSAIVVSPTNPYRFYIAVAGEEAVQTVDLTADADGKVTLVNGTRYTNTGAIGRLAINGAGTRLFGSDISTQYVHRLSLTDGSVSQIDVGGPSLDVMVAPTLLKQRLYVALPLQSSIGVFDVDTGEHIDVDAPFTPRQAADTVFPDIYLGAVPARMMLASNTLEWQCAACSFTGATSIDRSPVNYVLVASDDGQIVTVDPSQNELVNHVYCQKPAVVAPTTENNRYDGTNLPLDPCGTPSRKSSICSKTLDETVDSGIVVFPGYTPQSTRWRLTYEALVPGLDRSNGGGRLSDDGLRLSDQSIDLSILPVAVQAGDLIAMASPPLATQAGCETAEREFKVERVDTAEGESRLSIVLDKPARKECFPSDVGYTARLAGSYLLTGPNSNLTTSPLTRLRPGDTYGLGLEFIRFTVSAQTTAQQDEFFEFVVSVPFERLVMGRTQSSSGTPISAGRIPSSIYMQDFGPAGTPTDKLNSMAFAAFAGNDLLVRFFPKKTTSACGYSVLLQ